MPTFIVLVIATLTICSGFQDASYRSSLMHGVKPILRLGPEEPRNAEEGHEVPKEPEWVTVLRTNIQNHIKDVGFDRAKPQIHDFIEEANAAVNKNQKINYFRKPEDRVPVKLALRTGQYRAWKSPSWEKDLKSYIHELISNYGRHNLDSLVNPVVKSIEETQHVRINDIDVNPYGEITVNYATLIRKPKSSPLPFSKSYQQDSDEDQHEPSNKFPGYTMGP